MAGSIVGVSLMTGLLNPAAYGELALGMTASALVNEIIVAPLQNGITRFYAPAQEKGDLQSYLSAARRMTLSATALIAAVALFALGSLVISGRTTLVPIALAALLFATLSGYNAILGGIQNAGRQRAIVALHQGIESWAKYLVAAGLMVFLGFTSTVALMGYVAAIMLVLLSQYVFFRRIVAQPLDRASSTSLWREQIWSYSWPLSTFGIFTWAQLVSDRWALGLFSSARDVGLYTVLFQVGYYPASIANRLVLQFLSPILFQRAGNATDPARTANARKLSSKLTQLVLGVTAAAFVLAQFFHRVILQALVTPEYLSVSQYLPWMLLSGGLFAAGQTITLNLMSQMKTRPIVAAKIVTAIMGVLLNVGGAYWYGITGIVVASNLFSMSYLAWMATLARSQGGGRSFAHAD